MRLTFLTIGVWQGVAMDTLKLHLRAGHPCRVGGLRPSSTPHLTSYAYAHKKRNNLVLLQTHLITFRECRKFSLPAVYSVFDLKILLAIHWHFLLGHRPRRGRSPLISSHMDAHSVRPYIHPYIPSPHLSPPPPTQILLDGRAGGHTDM
jgi:hypothetical protein